ncbi:MAG: DUF1987 domain-containing protein [Treponema sp.]|nr:DUF1987 domain-containing protein [Treponema sp.]
MAFHLERQKTTSTPYILIDEEKGYMKISGRSFNENVMEFFSEINDWLDSYLDTDFGIFTFDCIMDYLNSSTVKVFSSLLAKMDNHVSDRKKIIINWITSSYNEIVIECGEDMREDVKNLTFNIVINEE